VTTVFPEHAGLRDDGASSQQCLTGVAFTLARPETDDQRQFDDLDGYHYSPFWMKPDADPVV